MLWRHGDVMIARVDEVPGDARLLPTVTLAHGEVTGHSHRVERPETAQVFRAGEFLYLSVTEEMAALVHEEHKRIELPRGAYKVWQQREYTPRAIVRVSD